MAIVRVQSKPINKKVKADLYIKKDVARTNKRLSIHNTILKAVLAVSIIINTLLLLKINNYL